MFTVSLSPVVYYETVTTHTNTDFTADQHSVDFENGSFKYHMIPSYHRKDILSNPCVFEYDNPSTPVKFSYLATSEFYLPLLIMMNQVVPINTVAIDAINPTNSFPNDLVSLSVGTDNYLYDQTPFMTVYLHFTPYLITTFTEAITQFHINFQVNSLKRLYI